MDYHLELTWSSLIEMKKQLDTMKDLRYKFHKVQEVNQKMSESVADCHAEIRDLSLAVKNLEMENIQQKKLIEDMAKKTARGIKNVEGKMVRYARADIGADSLSSHRRAVGSFLPRSYPKQNDVDIPDSFVKPPSNPAKTEHPHCF